MKGIVIKDIMTSRRIVTLYMMVLLVFAGAGGETGMLMAMIYSIMLPVHMVGLDERSRFERLLPMFPVSSLHSVLAKYIIAYGFMFAAVLVSLGVAVVRGNAETNLYMILPGMAVSLLAQGVMLPLIFWFGVEKGRVAYLLVFVALILGMGEIASLFEQQLPVSPALMGALAAGAAFAVNIASIFVSAKGYEKRLTA